MEEDLIDKFSKLATTVLNIQSQEGQHNICSIVHRLASSQNMNKLGVFSFSYRNINPSSIKYLLVSLHQITSIQKIIYLLLNTDPLDCNVPPPPIPILNARMFIFIILQSSH